MESSKSARAIDSHAETRPTEILASTNPRSGLSFLLAGESKFWHHRLSWTSIRGKSDGLTFRLPCSGFKLHLGSLAAVRLFCLPAPASTLAGTEPGIVP